MLCWGVRRLPKRGRSSPFLFRKRLDKYDDIRHTLQNMNLTQKTPNVRGCGKAWTEDWRCDFMHSVHFCTLMVG